MIGKIFYLDHDLRFTKLHLKLLKLWGLGAQNRKCLWNVNVLLPQKQSSYYLVPENI